LLAGGADAKAKNSAGKTPLDNGNEFQLKKANPEGYWALNAVDYNYTALQANV
jgi:hypothetical protein